jgi:hypothetical protein
MRRILNELVRQKPVYLLNSVNPYRIEGQKTAAIELLEQLAWEPPDHIIVPGGNLGNSSAIGKALLEMRDLKLISRLPKLSIIQAQGANPFYRSVREFGGKKLEPMTADTLATAIRIGNPASWKKALRVLQATGGEVEQVTELEIAVAKAEIGADGIGCEPASAVTLAGLKKLRRSGIRQARRKRCPDPDRPSAQGSRLHHQVPSRGFISLERPKKAEALAGKTSAARPGRARCQSGGRHCRPRRGREKFVAVRPKFVYKTQFNCDCRLLGIRLSSHRAKAFHFYNFSPVHSRRGIAL